MTKLAEKVMDLADDMLMGVVDLQQALEYLRYDPESATEEDYKKMKKIETHLLKIVELVEELEDK